MRYSHLRVLTVSELSEKEVLHCGQITDGVCMEWTVVGFAGKSALIRVGGERTGSLIQITGREIRDIEMYRASDCPYCGNDAKIVIVEKGEGILCKADIESSNIASSFLFREARRLGGRKSGAAFIRKIDNKRK